MFGPGNAQLPLPPMLMFDRIVRISDEGGEHGKGEIVAELDINPDLWFFGCHFENDPVMPGCLGVDALWQLVGFFSGLERREGSRSGFGLRRDSLHRAGTTRQQTGAIPSVVEEGCDAAPIYGHRRWLR